MSIDDRRPLTPQAVLGACVIALGLLLFAANLGWVEAGSVLRFWPIGLVAVGGAMWARAIDARSRLSAGVVLAVGGWLTLARILGYHASLADLWPVALIAIGVTLIMRARERHDASGVPGDTLSDFAVWSGVQRRVTSPVFKRADFTVVMGGIEVDLRGAGTAGDAVIDVFVLWGGIEIRVPPDWAVSNQVVAIMGGASDKSTGSRDARHRLVLRGFVLMGGVEIKV